MQIGNLKVDAGYVSYYENDNGDKPIALGIILGVVIPIIAIIILLAICVIRRHRKNKPSQNYIPDVWKETEEKNEDEEMALNHVSVKADMNGSIPDDKGNEIWLTHCSRETRKRVIGKQYRPRAGHT